MDTEARWLILWNLGLLVGCVGLPAMLGFFAGSSIERASNAPMLPWRLVFAALGALVGGFAAWRTLTRATQPRVAPSSRRRQRSSRVDERERQSIVDRLHDLAASAPSAPSVAPYSRCAGSASAASAGSCDVTKPSPMSGAYTATATPHSASPKNSPDATFTRSRAGREQRAGERAVPEVQHEAR